MFRQNLDPPNIFPISGKYTKEHLFFLWTDEKTMRICEHVRPWNFVYDLCTMLSISDTFLGGEPILSKSAKGLTKRRRSIGF